MWPCGPARCRSPAWWRAASGRLVRACTRRRTTWRSTAGRRWPKRCASLAHFAAKPDVEAGRLVPVLADWWTRRLEIPAVFPSFKSLSPAVRAFVDLIAERLPARLAHNAAPD